MSTGFVRRDKGKSLAQVQYLGQKSFTALAGGAQAGATPLTNCMVAVLGTVASSGDSVSMPPANVGLSMTVINPTSNPAWVFGSSGPADTINGLSNATGIRMSAKSAVFFQPSSQGNWITEGLGSGYAGNYPTLDSQNSLTAHAGGGSTAALVLPAVLNRVTTVATSGDSVKLPSALSGGGIQITVANGHSSNPMQIYGQSSSDGTFATVAGTIASSTGQSISSGKLVTYTTWGDGVWHGVPSS